jgi:hypothetical protein
MARGERNLSDCRDSATSCDLSKLSPAEMHQVSAPQQQRNFSNCIGGWCDCDRFKLSQLQARKVADAEHQRNFSECKKRTRNLRLLDADRVRSQSVSQGRAPAQLHSVSEGLRLLRPLQANASRGGCAPANPPTIIVKRTLAEETRTLGYAD